MVREEKLQNKEQLIQDLQTKITETQQELTQTKKQEADKTKKIERLETKLKLLEETKTKLEKELAETKQLHHNQLAEIVKTIFPSSVNLTDISFTDLKNQAEKVVKEKVNYEKETKELKTTLTQEQAKTQLLTQKTQELQTELTQQKATNQQTSTNLQNQLKVKEKELQEIRDKTTLSTAALRSEITSLQEQLQQSQEKNKQLSTYQEQIKKLTVALAKSQERLNLAQNQKEQLARNLKEITKTNQGLQTKVINLEVQIKSKEELIQEITKKNQALANALSKQEISLENRQKIIAELTNQLDYNKELVNTAQLEKERLTNSFQQLEEKLSQFQQKRSEQEKEINQLKQKPLTKYYQEVRKRENITTEPELTPSGQFSLNQEKIILALLALQTGKVISQVMMLKPRKQTKKKPPEVAQEIIKITNCSNLDYNITEQGYINFRFPATYYQQFLTKTLAKEGQNLRSKRKSIRINIEYVSANPTGYLHLAHFRHAVIGNALANVYQFCGYKITREYYINDRGGQITSLINSVYFYYHQLQNISLANSAKIEYAGQASQEVAQKLIEKWGNKYICQELNEEEINFDIWFSETSLYEKGKHEKLLTELKAKNLIYSQAGATFFRTSLGGDDKDRVIIKQDSDYTYFFSDILYHLDKLKRADKLINIWGADHHGFIARLKSACQLLSYKPEDIQIILVQIVNLLTKEGRTARFSKRAGNTIELAAALKYVDMDQLKFFLCEKEPSQPISINIKVLKENQEKTCLYYIQYAHARCHQIFHKAQEKNTAHISSNINLLSGAKGRKILNLLIRFSLVLENIIEENKPHPLIHYLYDLAHAWQVYYQNNTILEPANPELTAQKLLLVKNIQIILKLGLGLMGIAAPNRM
ncbi:7576_t:CDS:2 [Ambispora gerdemannii]|uniref:arginine--tRNA ligase n=1 Tax=Ambispora gerdemannii TaxID=144530 RepID=A0A9N8ZUG1_9GLOM|nr:7576_t:CDS:2 [Ambispora gerdemannii]